MDNVLFPKTLMLCWAVVACACEPKSEETRVNTATQSQTMWTPETKDTAPPAASAPAPPAAGPAQRAYPDAIHPRQSEAVRRQIEELESSRFEIEAQRRTLMQSPMFTKKRCRCTCP